MPYGESLSQVGTTKGIAAELHLGALRYVDGQDEYSRASGENAIISLPARTSDKPQAKPIRIDYTASSGIYSYGMDPMVSQASVIHELAYGRINTAVSKTGGSTGYPIPRDLNAHDLDIIV
jgi:hypothetical protein